MQQLEYRLVGTGLEPNRGERKGAGFMGAFTSGSGQGSNTRCLGFSGGGEGISLEMSCTPAILPRLFQR